MSELYPTPSEYQEILNEIWAADPALYGFITGYDDEESEPPLDDCGNRDNELWECPIFAQPASASCSPSGGSA